MKFAFCSLLLLMVSLPVQAAATAFTVRNTGSAAWGKILGSVGISEGKAPQASIVIAGESAPEDSARLAADHILVLIGNGPAAAQIGIQSTSETLSIRQICDTHATAMQIIWEQPADTHVSRVPLDFQVFATERWKGSPVLAGKKTAHGAVLWMATEPGPTGIERYPYVIQALSDLGLELPAQTSDLWAFFDSSYRIRADVDYLATRWRKTGISVLHVAAWHNMEPDPIQDAYLKRLIEACHQHAILVYAWLELPHVSEKFWADHPQWREKTGVGQDAQLDWRKLMNLQNPDCRNAVAAEVDTLLNRFDWDGVNVAELYFESLEGASNAARFTPMNDDVRADFKRLAGFDPKLLFDPDSQYSAARNGPALRKFLDYRAELASRMQSQWLDVIDRTRAQKPYLDVVLTHIDDQFEPGIRDELGADVVRSLPAIEARNSTLLVEDPATLWSLGPERYAKLGNKYRELTGDHRQAAVDINVVDRYQDVYPTKKQTGVELLELVHQAAESFSKVALYFENSLEKQDLALLPAAATTAHVEQQANGELDVSAADCSRIAWHGPVDLDGKIWPLQTATAVIMPIGKHRLTPAPIFAAVTLTDFNGELRTAAVSSGKTDVSYVSRSRAVATPSSKISMVEVDGTTFWKTGTGTDPVSFLPPAGQHLVTFYR
jgi:hypothetical protein